MRTSLSLNLSEINALDNGNLTAMSVPVSFLCPYSVGDTIPVKEPWRKSILSVCKMTCDGPVPEDEILGVQYRSDLRHTFMDGCAPATSGKYRSDVVDTECWMASRAMPEWAIRRHIKVESICEKPLSAYSDEEIHLLRLDYDTENNPQMLIVSFTKHKNYEQLLNWFAKRYPSAFRKQEDPLPYFITFSADN